LLCFPVIYGAASNGQFEGRGKHHDRWESTVSGEIHTTADASGCVVLPGNDTLSDIIRIHIRKIENIRQIPISSGFAFDHPANDSLFSESKPEIVTTDTYQWYEEGYRYPVFETIETYRNDSIDRTVLTKDAYFYHPAEHAYLPEDTANQVVRERKQVARKAKTLEKESNLLSFSCYPNPMKDRLVVELTFSQAAIVDAGIWEMDKRLIRRFQSKTPVIHYRETLDVRTYLPGYYVVRVTIGGETVSAKILKL